jgi:hypothetical protein
MSCANQFGGRSGQPFAYCEHVRVLTLVLISWVGAAAENVPLRPYWEDAAILRGQKLLWHDPGAVEKLDLRYGIGGRTLAPRVPFTFLKEDAQGSTPKVLVRDGAGRKWSVKFGNEVSADVFGSRIAWALGYYAEPAYYVARGILRGAVVGPHLSKYVDARGHFSHARFQLRSKSPEYLTDVGWSWSENPFAGTPQLNGLRILMMLLSNWDDKDIRDAEKRGSNTAIYRDGRRYLFFVSDWGAALGNWGHGPGRWGKYVSRSKWDCVDYYGQSRKFVKGVNDGEVDWGYQATHTKLMTEGVRPGDVRWLMRYLGRLTDRQIHSALLSSGAGADEAACYVDAMMLRIQELRAIARTGTSTRQVAERFRR